MSGRRRQRGLELGVVLLASEMLRLGLDNIPPVTLATVVAQVLVYVGVIDVGWDEREVCVSGHKVWHEGRYACLLLSTVHHASDMHLYYNMVSYLVKGQSLERKHGSRNFALLLAVLCVATPVMYVFLALISSHILEDRDIMWSCAVGFSGVIFALKTITTVEERGESYVAGLRVPLRYSAWVELLAIHILVPNASFMGHLAGILVGILYAKTYVGTLVDYIISSISGERMRHNTSRARDSTRSRGQTWSDTRVPGYENDYEDTYHPGATPSYLPRDQWSTPPQPGWRF